MTLHPMSLDQPDCVLAALDILCNVRWQALQPYHAKVFRALHESSEPSPSAKSNDDTASPCSGPDSPRSSSDNNDLPSLPDHFDSSCAASNSHDPPSPSRPPGPPSTLYNQLDPPTISDHSDASQAFSTKHDYPQPCSLPNHLRLLSPLPNIHSLSSSEHSNFPAHSADNRECPLDDHSNSPHHKNTLALTQALNKAQDKIRMYLSKSEIAATEGKSSWTQEDPRIVDLQMGKKETSSNLKFRKVLSQRSLAREYDRWELETYQTSRINQLVGDLSDSKERADGHIKEYVDANTHRFKNRNLAQHGIHCGIRLLVFERLLGERGSSAILCFSFHRFRLTNFPELACLRQKVCETAWIWSLTKAKSDWLGSCQSYYDGIVDSRLSGSSVAHNHVPSKRCSPAPESSGKRPRLGQYNHRIHLQSPLAASAAGHEECESSGLSLDITSQDKAGTSLNLLAEAATNVEPLILTRAEALLPEQRLSPCEGPHNDTTISTADIAALQSSAHRSNSQTGYGAASQWRSLSTSGAAEVYSQDMLDGNTSDPSLFPDSGAWATAPIIDSSNAVPSANPYDNMWAKAPTIDSSNAAPSANPYDNMWASAPIIHSSNTAPLANPYDSMWDTAPIIHSSNAAPLADTNSSHSDDWNGPANVDPRLLILTAS